MCGFKRWRDVCPLPNKTLMLRCVSTEVGRQVTFCADICFPVCVCVLHLVWEQIQRDRTGSHGTDGGCINNNSGSDFSLAAHTEQKEREREQNIKNKTPKSYFCIQQTYGAAVAFYSVTVLLCELQKAAVEAACVSEMPACVTVFIRKLLVVLFWGFFVCVCR